MESKKGSVRSETNAVSGTTVAIAQNRHQKPLHPLCHQHRGRSASREKSLRGKSPSGKFNRQLCRDFLKGNCTESPCEYWHPPECFFIRSESGCKFGAECLFLTGRLRNNQTKGRRRVVTKSAVPIVKPTQLNPNPNHDRTGRPVVTEQTSLSSNQENRYKFLSCLQELNLRKMQIMMERRDPFFAHNQSVQWQTRLTSTSEYLDCHILLWNKLKTIVFVSSWRRSRTTLTDNLFNEIYNKTMPTTHSVKSPKRWWRTWAMWSYFSCARQFLKYNAKNAFFTGIKASFIALVGISWERINPADVSTDGKWIFSQSRTMSLRRGDLMAIVMGRQKNKQNTRLPTIWERDASKRISKKFTTASRKIQHSVTRYSKLIELKKYASRWTRMQRKISPFVCRKTSTFDTKRIGGSLSISLEKSDRWESVLTPTMRWPHHTVFTKNLEKQLALIPFWQYQQCTARLGGSGTIPDGAHDNWQESPQLSSWKERHDRTVRPVVPFLHTTSDV